MSPPFRTRTRSRASYDAVEGAHAWAQKTIAETAGDKREVVYSQAQLDGARTHDEIWNAAQRELVRRGKMAGFMRMCAVVVGRLVSRSVVVVAPPPPGSPPPSAPARSSTRFGGGGSFDRPTQRAGVPSVPRADPSTASPIASCSLPPLAHPPPPPPPPPPPRAAVVARSGRYWAKKILEWTESTAEALRIAIYLNDRYHLDGRDPNGFCGCMWAICGVHDRAWGPVRPVFGKIRFMNAAGCKRKFDTARYIAMNPR